MKTQKERVKNEINHFTKLEHIWWGARTYAGRRRYDNRYRLFKGICKPSSKSRILEIGCGDGEFTKRLLKLPSTIEAIDVTPEVILRARKIFARKDLKRIKFKVENVEKMSYRDGFFDVVCGISILHHVNYTRTIKEIYRVLRKGGSMFFSEPNLLNPVVLFGLNTPFLREKMEFSPDETALLRWRIERILKKVGFKSYSVFNYDFLYPKTPKKMVEKIEKIGSILEKTPLLKEISGSLIIIARK